MEYETFVVRILLNELNSMVEGQITHVASQQTAYFRELSKALAFIKEHLELGAQQSKYNASNGHARPVDQDDSKPHPG